MNKEFVRMLSLVVIVGIFSTFVTLQDQPGRAPAKEQHVVSGYVLDDIGEPVNGAKISVGDATVKSNPDGSYETLARGTHMLKAIAAGHLPRTQAVREGTPVDVILTRDAADTVAVRFGGDVMFGRRFYEPQNGRPPALTSESDVTDYADLLADVRPLFDDSDITEVNLESPLGDDPYFDPNAPRPARFHQTKRLAFASDTKSAQALRRSGVDVVGLSNNHVTDLLEEGILSTIAALDKSGLAHFGAGRNEDEAWAPAYVQRKGRTVAFLGCTTITGRPQPIPYVAGPDRAGAAECKREKLRSMIGFARRTAQEVVVQIHGGVEYQRTQTADVRALFALASESGASIVVGGHPHVIGGIEQQGGVPIVASMGNQLFDQDLWSTFPSYMLRADLRDGGAVATTVDPIFIAEHRPHPVVGSLADSVSRIAAGTVPGAARLADPGASLEILTVPDQPESTLTVMQPDRVRRLAPGWWVSGGSPTRVGQDLLYGSGLFEDLLIGERNLNASLWQLGKFASLSRSASCKTGRGVSLLRGPVSTKDVYATPAHRIQVATGQQLSLILDVRQATAGSAAELAWYTDEKGPSAENVSINLSVVNRGKDDCQQVRLNAIVPPGIRFVQPYLKLIPPTDRVRTSRMKIDSVRLVSWAPPGSTGRLYDTVESVGGVGNIEFTRDSKHNRVGGPFAD